MDMVVLDKAISEEGIPMVSIHLFMIADGHGGHSCISARMDGAIHYPQKCCILLLASHLPPGSATTHWIALTVALSNTGLHFAGPTVLLFVLRILTHVFLLAMRTCCTASKNSGHITIATLVVPLSPHLSLLLISVLSLLTVWEVRA